jgi:hypothetical protein
MRLPPGANNSVGWPEGKVVEILKNKMCPI